MRKGDDMPQFAVELNRLCEVKWPGGDRSANNQLADYVSGHTGRAISTMADTIVATATTSSRSTR